MNEEGFRRISNLGLSPDTRVLRGGLPRRHRAGDESPRGIFCEGEGKGAWQRIPSPRLYCFPKADRMTPKSRFLSFVPRIRTYRDLHLGVSVQSKTFASCLRDARRLLKPVCDPVFSTRPVQTSITVSDGGRGEIILPSSR